MSRRSHGRALNGWLVVDKTVGQTSTKIVNKIKWLLNARKAGHAGTLDPDATGILAIALGEATKTIPYLTNSNKTYHFTVHFGAATDTDDISGHKIKISNNRPTDAQLAKALNCFIGEIQQIPPKYSAVKINGIRAYQLSREGEKNFKLKPRKLIIEKLDVIERVNSNSVRMKMVCGKGGYVRSIARDIGEKLGCFGHAAQIRRTSTGPFTLSDAISDDFILEENVTKIFEHIRPIQSTLDKLRQFDCQENEVNDIKNGMKVYVGGHNFKENSEVLTCFNNKPVAIGKVINNNFYPKRVFNFATR